jgi:hypothetical protein
MSDDNAYDYIYDESGFVIGRTPQSQRGYASCLSDIPECVHPSQIPDGFITKDSGKRMQETTGAQRDTNDGKGRFDLIAPEPLRRLAELYQRGAEKYGDRNWEKGINLSRYIDSALRHINDYQAGDRSEDHLISAAWNLFSFVATEDRIKRGLLPTELDNIPKTPLGKVVF